MLTKTTEWNLPPEMLRFHAGLLDRLAEAVISTDAELRIVSWNQAAARLYGWGAPEAVGRPLHDLLQTELVDTTWPEFDDHLRRDDAWSGELVNRHRDGRALTLAASVALVRDAAGNVVGGVGIHRDVTAERASERALRASEAFNRSLRRALPDPLFGIDAQGNVCTLLIPDSLSGQLPPPFILDPSSHTPGAAPPAVEPSVLAEAQKHLEAARTTGIPQSFEYSLPHQGRTHHFETRIVRSTPEDVVAVVRDITERREAEERLRYHADLVDQISDAVVSTGPDRRIKSWNRAAERIYGWSAAEVLGRFFDDVVQTQFVGSDMAEARAYLYEHRMWHGEVTHLRKDGRRVHLLASSSLLQDSDGQNAGGVTIFRDITAQRQAEEEAHTAKELLAGLMNNAPAPFYVMEDGERFRLVNKAWEEATGRSSAEALGHTMEEFFTAENAAAFLAVNRQVLATGEPVRAEERMDTPDGPRYFEVVKFPLRNASGRITSVGGLSIEITQRKRVEEALRASEERYRALSELTSDYAASMTVDADGSFSFDWITEAFSRATGYDSNRLRTPADLYRLIYPEDLPVVLDRGKTLLTGRPTMGEYRIVTKQGDIRWVSAFSRGFVDESKTRVTRVYSAWQDITERKLAEEQARREAARTASLTRVASRLNAELDLDVLLGAICEEIVGALDVPLAVVALWDEQQGTVFRRASFGEPQEFVSRLQGAPAAEYEWMFTSFGHFKVHRNIQAENMTNSPAHLDFDARTVVSAALLYQERIVGLLAVYVFGTEREFTDDELTLLRAMADHSAQAVANARLFEEVRLKSSQLQALSAQLAAAQESERQRIARDLHDQVGSTLTALGLNLGILRSRASTTALARLGGTIDSSRKLLEEATEQIRSIMADLRPPVLDDYGLLAALRWYTERFEPWPQLAVEIDGTEPVPRLLPQVEIAFFRIAQEALTNAAKHAHARKVVIALAQGQEAISLSVSDDGVGFDTRAAGNPQPGKWGLVSMRQRAEAIGGQLHLKSSPGRGTTVGVELRR